MAVRRVNLVPQEVIVQRRVKRQTSLLGLAMVVFLVLLGAFWFFRQMELKRQEERRDLALAEVAVLETKVAALQEFAALEETVKKKRLTLATSMANDVAWSRLLIEFSMIIPGDSWLTTFAGTADAPGTAPAGGAPPPAPPGGTAATSPPPGGTAAATSKIGSLTFAAVTFDFPGVAKWITRLQELKSVQNIWVPSAAKGEIGEREVVNYSSTADLSGEAASGRYQPAAGAPR